MSLEVLLTFVIRGNVYTISRDAILFYEPKDVDILDDFIRTPKYHGNTLDVDYGRHGLTLCPEELRLRLWALPYERQCYLVQQELLRRSFGGRSELSEDEEAVISDYFSWRRSGNVSVIRDMLCLFFSEIFARGSLIQIPRGWNYRMRVDDLSFILDLYCHNTIPTEKTRYDCMSKKIVMKLSSRYEKCYELLDHMKEFSRYLKKTYTFTPAGTRLGKKPSYLFSLFQDKHVIPDRRVMCSSTLKRIFKRIISFWMPFPSFIMTEKSNEQELLRFIERPVTTY